MMLSGCRSRASAPEQATEDPVALPYILSEDPVVYDDICTLSDIEGLSAEYVRTEHGSCVYSLFNSHNKTYSLAEDCHLDVFVEDNWYRIQYDQEAVGEGVVMAFTDMSYDIEPNCSRTERRSLEYYGVSDLVPGEYRLVLRGNRVHEPPQWFYIPFTME